MAGQTTYLAWTVVDSRRAAEALAEAMERLAPGPQGVGILEIEDGSGLWEVAGYFSGRPDKAGIALLEVSFGSRPFLVSELPETDWVTKVQRELPPVEAGRFFIHGSHDADRVPEGRAALLVEAATAFGTGHHGTTLGCLLALERLENTGVCPNGVMDLGCGTAVLAMAAALAWPVDPIASDNDEVAVEVARTNIRVNGLQERIHCVQATGLDHPEIIDRAPYDLVFANILKDPLIHLAPSIARVSVHGGHVVLSGLLDAQVQEVRGVYEALGFGEVYRDSIAGWTTLTVCLERVGQSSLG